ncbi:OppA family ABC transporter substrate-binding lipoprotein [[Mycoplasma] gypis]|uniref:Lipoprotein n=1 Tax=[Mycoplasma] gypis TaxID=92404 RepID=A0ABZ2RUV4_9BACT|nr:hypothetical protein [[Mycoplasma] gypis]MBN0919230.1 hypothetical protein [[Mycoplasma] gypis]
MKQKWFKKSVLLSSLAVVSSTLVAVPFIAASCNIKTAAEQKMYAYSFNVTKPTSIYRYDMSSSYGSIVAAAMTSNETGGMLIKQQSLNQPSISFAKGDSDSENVKIIVTKPTFWKYRLDLADAVVLTYSDGSTEVFDTDEVDDLDSQRGEGQQQNSDGSWNLLTSRAWSSNNRSINSKYFYNKAHEAVKMQLTVKDQKWTNIDGTETKYKLTPRDFYYSWMRTVLRSQGMRLKNGSVDDIENVAAKISASKGGTIYFTEEDNFPNEYLYGLYYLNTKDFYDESKFVTAVNSQDAKVAGKQAVTFNKKEGVTEKSGFFDLINDMATTYTFFAAPSQYIDDVTKEKSYSWGTLSDKTLGKELKDFLTQEEITVKKEVTEEENGKKVKKVVSEKIKNPLLGSLSEKFGMFWYGMSDDHVLFAGGYVPDPKGGANNEDLVQNPNYWDKTWVNADDSIKKISIRYQSGTVDPTIYENKAFNEYKQGTLTTIRYTSLNEAQKREVLKNADKYGVRYLQTFTDNTLLDRFSYTPYPKKLSLSKEQKERLAELQKTNSNAKPTDVVDGWENNFSYSNAYARMMYGQSLKDLANGENSNVLETFYTGTGLQLRSIIQTAVNWLQFGDTYSNGLQEFYGGRLAPDAPLGGTDQETYDKKTPRDALNELSSTYLLDSNLHRIALERKISDTKSESLGDSIENSEVRDYLSSVTTNEEKFKSPAFEQIKARTKELLDSFYKANPDLNPEVDKVKWTYFYPFTNFTSYNQKAFKSLIQTFNSLDDRLEVSLNENVKNDNEIQKAMDDAGLYYIAWGYDYTESASGFDGYSSTAMLLVPVLYTLASKPELLTKLESSFSHVVNAAKALKQYYDSGVADGSFVFSDAVKPSQWEALMKKYGANLFQRAVAYFNSENGSDLALTTALFWKKYIANLTNEEIIKLNNEITNFSGWWPSGRGLLAKNRFNRFLTQPEYMMPYSANRYDWIDFYKIAAKDKNAK